MKSLWKVEPVSRPVPSHAADAIEIVNGEAVRRVTLSQMDYDVYLGGGLLGHYDVALIAQNLKLGAEDVSFALHRLATTGLIEAPMRQRLQ